MTPIFDLNTRHVGWFDREHVFDLQMQWVAFQHGGHLYSAGTLEWLGPYVDGSLNDRGGRPVGWRADRAPIGTGQPLPPAPALRPMAPMRPVKPIAPRRPLLPRYPLRGWSALTFEQWLGRAEISPPGEEVAESANSVAPADGTQGAGPVATGPDAGQGHKNEDG